MKSVEIPTTYQPDASNFKSGLKPIWCPGCGDFGVLGAICKALASVKRPPHEIAFVSGIGCSSRIPGYTSAYGFNSVHGRALPIAQGIKIANPDLLVLAAGGDGDGFSIGGGHLPHAIRRNLDLTYIVMDNQVYGLTKGQLSPTARVGSKSVTSVYGSMEVAGESAGDGDGLWLRLRAQGTPADLPGLISLIEQAIRYPGFAFVNVQSPCVTFGSPEWQLPQHKSTLKKLSEMGHDSTDRNAAFALAQHYGEELHVGVLYQNPSPPPSYDQLVRERQAALMPKAVAREPHSGHVQGGVSVHRSYLRWHSEPGVPPLSLGITAGHAPWRPGIVVQPTFRWPCLWPLIRLANPVSLMVVSFPSFTHQGWKHGRSATRSCALALVETDRPLVGRSAGHWRLRRRPAEPERRGPRGRCGLNLDGNRETGRHGARSARDRNPGAAEHL